MDGLTQGRIVHYVISAQDNLVRYRVGEHRAAIVTNAWPGSDLANLHVFWDDTNDEVKLPEVVLAPTDGMVDGELSKMMGSVHTTPPNHKYSAHYSEAKEPGTWHWIEQA